LLSTKFAIRVAWRSSADLCHLYAIRKCEPLIAIRTKLRRRWQQGARSIPAKFNVNRTSDFETAVDARNPVQAIAGQPSKLRLSVIADERHVRSKHNMGCILLTILLGHLVKC
jgi:hypothetical protein